jgi:hypothetical protein
VLPYYPYLPPISTPPYLSYSVGAKCVPFRHPNGAASAFLKEEVMVVGSKRRKEHEGEVRILRSAR